MGPLAGVRVLDLSRVLAGPWASQLLADLGADVVKVEAPGRGDDTRHWGPPELVAGEAAYFHAANRGKRSIALDLARDRDTLLALVDCADVVIENFKVGGLARFGLDYPSLKARRPELIYCSITGFGQDGPWAQRPGYDLLIQGLGGLMSITGQPDGVPGGGPVKVGVALVDILTGLYATIGIQAALRHRERTGEGQQIDLALLDVSVAVLANQAMNYLATGQAPGRLGNGHPNIVPYDVYPTSDGHLILAVGNDGQFAALTALLGAPGWAQDPDFATNAARVRQRHRLNALITERLLARSSAEWSAMLEAAGVPGGPILTLDALFALEQGAVRGWVQQVQRGEQSLPTLANPLHLSATPVCYGRASPALDGDRDTVLRDWLGQE